MINDRQENAMGNTYGDALKKLSKWTKAGLYFDISNVFRGFILNYNKIIPLKFKLYKDNVYYLTFYYYEVGEVEIFSSTDIKKFGNVIGEITLFSSRFHTLYGAINPNDEAYVKQSGKLPKGINLASDTDYIKRHINTYPEYLVFVVDVLGKDLRKLGAGAYKTKNSTMKNFKIFDI